MALDWVLKLVDQFSGPAKTAAGSANQLNGVIAGAGGGFANFGQQMKDVAAGLETLGLDKVLDMAKAVASEALTLVEQGAKMAIDASGFKDSAVTGLEAILGSRTEAEKMFAQLDEIAGRLGIEDEKIQADMRKLLVAGLAPETALAAVKAAADLAAVRGEGAQETLVQLISTIQARGHFDARMLRQLATLGVSEGQVFDQLSKKLGKTTDEIKALAKAGKIDAVDAIDAISHAVEGRFGGAAEKMADTFPKLLFRIKDALGDLFQDVDLGPLKDVMKSILEVLSGPEGKLLGSAISDFFGTLFKTIAEPFQGPEGKQRLKNLVIAVANAIEWAALVLKKYGPTVVAVIAKIIDVVSGTGEGDTKIRKIAAAILDLVASFSGIRGIGAGIDAFTNLAKALGLIPDSIPTPSEMIAKLGQLFDMVLGYIQGWIENLFASGADAGSSLLDGVTSGIEGAVGDIVSGAFEAGSAIIDGLAGGVSSNAMAVVTAVIDAAGNAIKAAEHILGIGSPSKVFHEIGGFTAQGFARGMAANTNAVDSAMGDMLAIPETGGATAGAAAAPRAAGGGITINVEVTAPEGSDGDDFGRAVARVLVSEIQKAGLAA